MHEPRSGNWVFGTLIVLMGLALFLAPSYGWKVREFLSPQASSAGAAADLQAENAELKAELAKLAVVAAQLPSEPTNYVRAMVYSRYPLNFKNELLVNAGTDQGIEVGKAVTFQGTLIGQVEQVFPDSALVLTVFDERFKAPVRIGSSGYDGLLDGGTSPGVRSIVKTAAVAAGDVVYAAGPGMPYGLPVGEIQTTSTSPDDLFEEASLQFPYDLNTIQSVFIQK